MGPIRDRLGIADADELVLVALEDQDVPQPDAGRPKPLDHLQDHLMTGDGERLAHRHHLDAHTVARIEEMPPGLHLVLAADQLPHPAGDHRLYNRSIPLRLMDAAGMVHLDDASGPLAGNAEASSLWDRRRKGRLGPRHAARPTRKGFP